MSLSGTTVLVTGAGGGSGETTARAFLHAGYPVIAGDLQVPVWETEYESLLTRVKMDISQEDQVNDVVRCAVESGHPIQILINNAGVAIGVPIEQMSTEIWNKKSVRQCHGDFFLHTGGCLHSFGKGASRKHYQYCLHCRKERFCQYCCLLCFQGRCDRYDPRACC